MFMANFLLQVREFLFFNLCLENYFNENSRVTCNIQLTSFFVSKALTRSYLTRSGF